MEDVLKKFKSVYPIRLALLGILIFGALISPVPPLPAANPEQANTTLALVPFNLNSPKKLPHIKKGVLHMLYARLSWPNHVVVIPQNQINHVLDTLNASNENQRVNDLALKTGSDFVLSGSITELAGSFSIDAKVFDIKNKRYMAFFEQSDKTDDLIDKVDRMAAAINKNVFQRSTLTWDKMEQEKQAAINELKRKNPEYLMENPNWQQTKESHGWKIWKYLF